MTRENEQPGQVRGAAVAGEAVVCNRPSDTLPVLWTEPNKLAAKRFCKSSSTSEVIKHDYDAGLHFLVLEPLPVNSIYDLSALLQEAEELPRALIIRGAPIAPGMVGTWVRRLGSGEGADFVGNFQTPVAGRHYVMIDIDKYTLPDRWTLDQKSVAKICEHLVQQLPTEFHKVSYHWQLSSSAGTGNPRVVSMHLWFWFDRPIADSDLKAWGGYVNAAASKKLVDTALFQHVQAHYTAAPVFTGMHDPFPRRSGLVQKAVDSVALVLPPLQPTIAGPRAPVATLRNAQAGSGFEYHLGQIGDHAGGDGFHGPIIRAIASYVAEHGTEGTNTELLYSTVRQRVLAADRSNHDDSYVEEMASGTHILAAIASAQRKYGEDAGRRRKTRRIEGIDPHFKHESHEATDIQQSMSNFLDRAR